jgi:hypothetical protein
VVKQAHRAAEAGNMAAGLAAQMAARLALGGVGVPAVLAGLPDRAAAVMEAVEGEPVEDLPGDADVMRRAGAWLDAFHRSGPMATAPFWPRRAAARFLRVVDDVQAVRRVVASPGQFARLARETVGRLEALRRRPLPVANRHGDMSGRNLLVGADAVWGIDFAPQGQETVTKDLSKLLAFLAERWPVDVLSGPLSAAFFAGYRLLPADEPALAFMVRMRLLSAWAGYPADTGGLSALHLARFRRIRRLLSDPGSGG